MFPKLDSLLLSQPRLAIICFLNKKSESDFKKLKETTGLTVGNLSIQLNKLKKEGLIEIHKQFKGNYPLTICKISEKGRLCLNDFFSAIESYRLIEDEIQTLSA